MPRIVTVTLNAAIDAIVRAPSHGKPGNELRYAAGKGVNVSRALSCLEHDSTAIVLCAESDRGWFEGQLQAMRPGRADPVVIGCRGATRVNRTVIGMSDTGAEHTRVDEDGRSPLTADTEQTQAIARELRRLDSGDTAVFAGSLAKGVTPAALQTLIETAAMTHARVVLDTSGAALQAAATAKLWLLKVNADEAGELLGKAIRSVSDAAAASRELAATRSATTICISLGKHGAVLSTGEGTVFAAQAHLPANVPVASTTGCGDALTAGLVHGWISLENWPEALLTGVKVATSSAAAAGPSELDLAILGRVFGEVRPVP